MFNHPSRHYPVWLILSTLLVLSLSCSLFGGQATPTPTRGPAPTPSQPTPTPQPLPPALVEIDPPLGAEAPLTGPLTLYFNQAMDSTSVERALASQASFEGEYTWIDDATLEINPSRPLAPESLVSLSLGEEVRSAGGLALSQPISLTFQTVGYLRPAQLLPEPDAADVDPTSAVVAAFNRPVVPLGAEAEDLLPGFTLEPAAEGRGEWLNTSTYLFYPDPGLEGGKTYNVLLNPDLQGVDGSPLEEALSWSFTTASPRLVMIEQADRASAMPLDAEITFTFNQPMDTESVEANFRVAGPGSASVPGQLSWDETHTVLTYKPESLLARSASYTAELGADAQARGGTPLGEDTNFEFQTVPDLAVTGSTPTQGGQKSVYEGVVLYFSGPILDEDTIQHISISPAITNLSAWWNESDYSLNVWGDFKAATAYTLTVSAGLSDPWGGELDQPYTLSFSTTPLDPQITFTTGTDVFYLTPEDASLVAFVTNISSIPLSVGSVSPEDFMTMIGPEGYEFRQTYRSADERTWEQPVELIPDRSQPSEIFVSPDGGPLEPGLYYLRFNFPQNTIYNGPFLLVVGHIQPTFKISATDALVWAVDLRTDAPAAGAQVTVYNERGSQIANGQTDDEGVFQASIPARTDPYSAAYAMIGQPGQEDFSLALSTWSQGLAPWEFGIPTDYRPPRQETYLYTDRPIYRPGQTVYFRGVVRQVFNGRYSPPDTGSIQLKLNGPFGMELDTIDMPLSAFGTGHGQYSLSDDVHPGYYTLYVVDQDWSSSITFQVADYRKPEINLQVSLPQEQAQAGETLEAQVDARYFFDAPAADVPVQWALYAARTSFDLPGYQAGDENIDWLSLHRFPIFGDSLGLQVASGEAKTDARGQLTLEVPTVFDQELIPQPDQPQRLTLEVTLQDESGLPVSARDEVRVNPAEFYIGVRPDAWVTQADQEIGFDVLVVDWDQQPAGARDLRAEFRKVIWVREDSADPYLGPTYTPQYTPAGSTDFRTNEAGQARVAFTPEEPGTFQMDVTGGGARTSFTIWVGGQGQAVWPNLPNQRLRLTADRQEYLPGDTAQVFVPNPFGAGALALVTVERGVVMNHQVLNLEPGGSSISLPLSGEEAPNVFVSVTLLGQNSEGRPDFRQGYTELKVEPVEQELNVSLTAQPERAGPGDEVTFEVQVTGADGEPVQGEFSLAVVDLAALALADPNSKDILTAFYGEQPLGVQTGLALAAYAHRQSALPPGEGGGGGGDVATVVREEFPDTAYWNAEIVTDENGLARMSVPLPDTLTTWQVDLRGLTADTRVGQAESQVVTSKELLVRPVTPRFLVVEDLAQLAAVVQNNTQNQLQAEVSLQATGFELDDPAAINQSVSVPAGGRTRVEWWGRAQDVDSVDLVFSAVAGDLEDFTRPALGALPVLRYTAPQTFATSGIMDEGEQRLELVSLPRSFDPGGGSLDVELAPSLATAMLNALEALENFPYDCTEQTLSRFLPNLETYLVLQEFGIDSPDLRSRLDRTLDEGLQRLLARQNPDGGWGWWQGGESDPFISAYILFGLSRAEQAGKAVGETSLQRAIDYLRSTMPAPAMVDETWQLDRLAFEHFALAQAGAGDQSGANALYEARDRLNPWAQALLALTLESLDPGSPQARTLISDLEASAIRSATGAHWEESEPSLQNMTSTLSNTAIVLYALAQRAPGSPLLADGVRYLMAQRQAIGAWNSTYSTAWSLMALSSVMQGTGELGGEFAFSATLNGSPIASGQAGQVGAGVAPPVTASLPISNLYPDHPNALVIQREAGGGRLYYTAGLTVSRPVESVAPLNRGVNLARVYTLRGESCPQGDCESIQSAPAGEQVTVRLTLTLPNDAYHLLVEDYIPAGSEILNSSLKTSQQGEEFLPPEEQQLEPLFDPREPFKSGFGWWFFRDPQVYDDHIAWAADFLPAGTYELTYTLTLLQPGEYRVLPARAWQFYFPEVQGNSAGGLFEVQP